MSKFLLLSVLLVAVAGCGSQESSEAKPMAFTISPVGAPKPGEDFEVHLKERGHSPTWIVSKDGSDIYMLGEAFQGRAASAHRIQDSSYNVNAVSATSLTPTLIWPKELGRGTYELCNALSDDLCINVTIE